MQDTLSFEEFTALERRNKLSQQKAARILKFRAMNGSGDGDALSGDTSEVVKKRRKKKKKAKGDGEGGSDDKGGEQGDGAENKDDDDDDDKEDEDEDDALIDSDGTAPSGGRKTNYVDQIGDAIESSGFQFVVTAMIVSLPVL